MGTIQNDSFYSSYLGDQIDLLLAAMEQANPLPSGTDWVAFIDDCRAAQESAENAQAAAEAAATAAETWASNPPYIGNNGNWYIYDTQTEQFVDSGLPSRGATGQAGPAGADGADGVSPTVAITQTADGHDVTITDADHPSGQTFTVDNGADGTDGTDGVSPDVTITTITGGHRVTITDANHPSGQSFDVMDGSGAGDMVSTTYDPDGDVASAGGIPDYVESQVPTAAEKAAWNAKADASDIPEGATAAPLMDGTAAVGLSDKWAKEDHIHPTDTTRQSETLSSPINVDGTNRTKVETALAAINTLAAGRQKRIRFSTATLTASGWTSNQQTVTVTGISATETDQLIQPVPAAASRGAYQAAGVQATAQAANSLTFTCAETPSSDLTVYVVLTELEAAV